MAGHRPTPKGSYTITEAYLAEIPIPIPTSKESALAIIDVVKELEREEFKLTGSDEIQRQEEKLDTLVQTMLGVFATTTGRT